MAKLTFNIPDNQVNQVVENLAYSFGYQSTLQQDLTDGSGGIQNIPNPETKQKFVKRMIAEELKHRVAEARAEIAGNEAANAQRTDVNDNVFITG